MKKTLKDTQKTIKFLKKLRPIYLVVCWAKYGTMSFPFSGKFIEKYGEYIPLVWDFDDHNGTSPLWHLRPIYDTTTGQCLTYSFNEKTAKIIAETFNKLNEHRRVEEILKQGKH